jgi:hypothetical protein
VIIGRHAFWSSRCAPNPALRCPSVPSCSSSSLLPFHLLALLTQIRPLSTLYPPPPPDRYSTFKELPLVFIESSKRLSRIEFSSYIPLTPSHVKPYSRWILEHQSAFSYRPPPPPTSSLARHPFPLIPFPRHHHSDHRYHHTYLTQHSLRGLPPPAPHPTALFGAL